MRRIERRSHGIDRRIPWVVGMPLRLKPFCPVPRPQQGDIDREMLGRQQAAATRLRDDVFKERARDVALQQPIPIVREPQRLRVRVRHLHWRQIARAITSSQLQCVTPIRLHAIARLHGHQGERDDLPRHAERGQLQYNT